MVSRGNGRAMTCNDRNSFVCYTRLHFIFSFLCAVSSLRTCYGFVSPRHPSPADGLSPSSSIYSIINARTSSNNPRCNIFSKHYMVHTIRDPDIIEMMVGGQKYEMVPLPDSMMETTIFVGNICEFAHDDDLSKIFQSVTKLQSVPACIIRKPNMSSMEYGFVTFPSVEEKEAAILRYHGVEFMGRKLKVEEIRDDPRKGRVRVPEKLVTYVVGAVKRTSRRRGLNTMRKIARLEEEQKQKRFFKQQSRSTSATAKKSAQRANSSDVALPRGSPSTAVSISSKGKDIMPSWSSMFACLKKLDQEEMLRAMRRGFISLEGMGYRTGRSKSRLTSAHRQWCDEHGLPQIVHCKAKHDNQLDCIIVDLSPLRIDTAFLGADYNVNDFLVRWKAQIVTAAAEAGMDFRTTDQLLSSDKCELLSTLDDEIDSCEDMDAACNVLFVDSEQHDDLIQYVVEVSEQNPLTQLPIARLPVLTMGVFEGTRSNAKQMAKELGSLWEIPEKADYVATSVHFKASCKLNGARSNGQRQQRFPKRDHRRRRRRNTRDNSGVLSYGTSRDTFLLSILVAFAERPYATTNDFSSG